MTDIPATTERPVLRIRGLTKSFGAVPVLRGIDLEVSRGEAVAVIGASGSGKTTLLRCINALEIYDEGSLEVDGVEVAYRIGADGSRRRRGERELAPIRAKTGMVFQLFNLFPHLTALENVMLGLTKVRRLARDEARALGIRWLERVGLGDRIDYLPSQLSGGQQQRVGIARALAMEPQVLLLDEITSALDPQLVGEVLAVVQELAQGGMTMVVVTHEMTFARDVAHRVVFMDEGRIVVAGTPEDVLIRRPHERLKAFLARLSVAHS